MKRDNVGIALFFVVVAFVLTMTILMSVFFGVNKYISNKKSSIPMYVFCNPSSDRLKVEKIANDIRLKKGIKSVSIITKDEAFKDMVSKFSIDKNLFSTNPFPYSLELFFKSSYTNTEYFQKFKKELLNYSIVDGVNFPLSFLNNLEDVKKKFLTLSESILSLLYIVEFIVFVSVISILYSHKKDDFDTLKFFGIKRTRIFTIFLKNTFIPFLFALFSSSILIIVIYSLYNNYADVYYIDKSILKESIRTTFILNLFIGFLFTLFSSIFVFFIKDEKV